MLRPAALALMTLVPAVALAAPSSRPSKDAPIAATETAPAESSTVSRVAFCSTGRCQIAVECPEGLEVIGGHAEPSSQAAELVTSAAFGERAWYAVAQAPRLGQMIDT